MASRRIVLPLREKPRNMVSSLKNISSKGDSAMLERPKRWSGECLFEKPKKKKCSSPGDDKPFAMPSRGGNQSGNFKMLGQESGRGNKEVDMTSMQKVREFHHRTDRRELEKNIPLYPHAKRPFTVTPSRKTSVANYDDHKSDATKNREEVKGILRRFRDLFDELLLEKQKNLKKQRQTNKRTDLQAAKLLEKQLGHRERVYVGAVPGIEIGDKFCYRMELRLVGLHRPPMSGIDSVMRNGERIAISVVASGYYANNMGDSDVLIYCGQGGNTMTNGHQEPEDQKWNCGNLALKNSIAAKNPVRVVRGIGEGRATGWAPMYIYHGLFKVESYWKERGVNNKAVFKFRLVRIS